MLAWVVTDRTHSRQTSPSFSPRSYSHFGSHPSLISEKISPFFSCTYVDPILQPLCFQIHECNGGVGSISSPLSTTHYQLPTILRGFILLRTLLHFFALAKNSTLLFSSDSALCVKKHNHHGSGWGSLVD